MGARESVCFCARQARGRVCLCVEALSRAGAEFSAEVRQMAPRLLNLAPAPVRPAAHLHFGPRGCAEFSPALQDADTGRLIDLFSEVLRRPEREGSAASAAPRRPAYGSRELHGEAQCAAPRRGRVLCFSGPLRCRCRRCRRFGGMRTDSESAVSPTARQPQAGAKVRQTVARRLGPVWPLAASCRISQTLKLGLNRSQALAAPPAPPLLRRPFECEAPRGALPSPPPGAIQA